MPRILFAASGSFDEKNAIIHPLLVSPHQPPNQRKQE